MAERLAHKEPQIGRPVPPNGLELSRSAEAGGAPHTVAPAGEQDNHHADSAGPPS